jgi:hypothetical protein
VDRYNGSTLYFGSRLHGLWKFAAGTWSPLRSLTPSNNGTYGIGVPWVVCDDSASSGYIWCQRLYASVHGAGIFTSPDAGATWNLISSSPIESLRASISSDGVLFATSAAEIWKYSPASGGSFITPPTTLNPLFLAIAVNPSNSADIIASQVVSEGGDFVIRSVNAGASWSYNFTASNGNIDVNRTVSWYPSYAKPSGYVAKMTSADLILFADQSGMQNRCYCV